MVSVGAEAEARWGSKRRGARDSRRRQHAPAWWRWRRILQSVREGGGAGRGRAGKVRPRVRGGGEGRTGRVAIRRVAGPRDTHPLDLPLLELRGGVRADGHRLPATKLGGRAKPDGRRGAAEGPRAGGAAAPEKHIAPRGRDVRGRAGRQHLSCAGERWRRRARQCARARGRGRRVLRVAASANRSRDLEISPIFVIRIGLVETAEKGRRGIGSPMGSIGRSVFDRGASSPGDAIDPITPRVAPRGESRSAVDRLNARVDRHRPPTPSQRRSDGRVDVAVSRGWPRGMRDAPADERAPPRRPAPLAGVRADGERGAAQA